MTEDNEKAIQKWSGGTVLFAGATDWSSIGRNIAGKKKGGADAVRAPACDVCTISRMNMQGNECSCLCYRRRRAELRSIQTWSAQGD